MARAIGALCITGTLFVPYAQPLLCPESRAPVEAGPAGHADHGTQDGHGDHPAPTSDNRLDHAGAAAMCHAAPTCGFTQVAPLRAAPTLKLATARRDAPAFASAGGQSVSRTTPAPPPRG